MIRRNNNGRNRNSRPRRKLPKPFGTKSSRAVAPFRVKGHRQILSVPEHNHQIRLNRIFRVVVPVTVLTGNFGITTDDVATAVRAELGIVATTTAGEIFAIHSATFYSLSTATNEFVIRLFDIEEVGGSGNSNCTGNFTTDASSAGIANISWVYPVNNRPTWSRSSPSLILLNGSTGQISTTGSVDMLCDLNMTYIRTPADNFLLRNRTIDDSINEGLTSNIDKHLNLE